MIKRGRIWRPDYQLVHPHRPGLLGCPDPAAPAGTNRYDNSAAKLWYLMGEAATPFANSGAGGARNLAYDAGTSDGEATYSVAGIFAGEDAADFHAPHVATKYRLQVDDTAWFGAGVTIWCWITPADYSARATSNWLWGRQAWWGGGEFLMRLDATKKVSVEVVRADASSTTYSTANNVITYGDPYLLAVTNDGNTTTIYVNGVDCGTWAYASAIATAANSTWNIGCELGQAQYDAIGVISECGFDNTCYSAATLLAMYNAAGV